MNISKTSLVVGAIAAILVGLAVGYALSNHSADVLPTAVTNGATQATAPISQQSISAVSTTTILSILNTDDNYRVINSVEAYYSGGAASTTIYSVTCATSSVATGYSQPATGVINYVLNTVLNSIFSNGVATSSTIFLAASTSPGLSNYLSTGNSALATSTKQWAPNSYLVCETTTTGGSTSNLLDAGYSGFIRFGISRQ